MKKIYEYEKNHEQFKEILTKAAEMRYKKMYDYGMSYKRHGVFGLIVRLNDKNERICNLMQSTQKANYESIEDNLQDMINYATMAIMELRREKHELSTSR